jgi:hypothetical protein
MCLCFNFVLIDDYAFVYLFLIIQNGYAYRFFDISICQKYQRKKTKQKQKNPNTMCVGHHYLQANTNNVNKTWALLQTTGGKDEPNIV